MLDLLESAYENRHFVQIQCLDYCASVGWPWSIGILLCVLLDRDVKDGIASRTDDSAVL
jgi:hypothetical protein